MVAYVAGEGAAFRVLFERYAPLLLRAMLRDLHVREEASDLVQKTFLQLHRARRDFDPEQKLRPWLFTIAFNLKREYFRYRKRRPEQHLDGDSSFEPIASALDAQQVEARRSLTHALRVLPAEQREVIELHWFHGLDFAEVALVVGASLSAVKVRAHRGYVRIKGALRED